MKKAEKDIVIFQASNGAIELRGDVDKETIWATQAQIAEVFGIERSVVTKHIRNVIKDGELSEKQVCANFAHTADDGFVFHSQESSVCRWQQAKWCFLLRLVFAP